MDTILFFTPLALYLAAVVLITLTTRSQSEDGAYFFASRRLGTVQAFLSVVSSETSVATIVAFPSSGMRDGYAVLWLLAGYIIGRTIVATFYLKSLYNSSRLTIYQTISDDHRVLEGAYLFAKYISGGVRFFMGGFALHHLLGGPILLWIVVVAVCVAGYSLTGGLRAVVVMDQVQSGLLVGVGVFLCVYLFAIVPKDGFELPAFFNSDWTTYSFSPMLLIGGIVLTIGSHGADQDLLLRILSTRSFNSARRSLVLSGFGAATLITMFLTIGYLLRYTGAANLDAKSPLTDYVARSEMPLLRGVFLVLLAAAAMSSLDSTIHSTGAIWKSLTRSTRVGRFWSGVSLVVMVHAAAAFIFLHRHYQEDLLSLALGAMNYVNAGMIGIVTNFTFFRRRLRAPALLAGLATGFAVTAACDWLFKFPFSFTVLFASTASFLSCYAMAAALHREPVDAPSAAAEPTVDSRQHEERQ